jgi:uncharacterized protein (DUF2252 family)
MMTWQGAILASMLWIDPVRLARRQLETDRDRTARFDQLLAHKIARMTVSPLAFLRGSAPLFYDMIERHPALAEGPAGEGWLVGDVHLENFGAYRADALSLGSAANRPAGTSAVVFDLNDFDEAVVGPWRMDVLRLVTSLVLGGREVGADGPLTLALCDALIDAYVGAAFHRKRAAVAPTVVSSLVEKVRRRSRTQLLDARTSIVRGKRHFVRGKRYQEVTMKLRVKAERAFTKYARRLPASDRLPEPALRVIDVAFRVAGTGSLGSLRLAVLVQGKGGHDGAWIFDMKEEGSPAAARVMTGPRLEPAERVCEAVRACVARPPRMMGQTRLRGSSMFVRRLTPQEDKLDLQALHTADLMPLARYLGALLGSAHRRGAKRLPKKPWTTEECERLLAKSIALAGAHEAAYLAYCELVRK